MSSFSRRAVLTGGAAATASLLVPVTTRPACAALNGETEYQITDWIMIVPSGQVTLGLSQPEVGQGSYTALPQILADELDADWQRVEVRFVTGKPAYRIAFRQEAPAQKEGASMSTTALYQRLRVAGAAARDVLIRAAAQKWRIGRSQCRTENGFVVNDSGNLSAISGVCTHQGCLLRHNEAAGRLDCPCHRASFSLQGDVLQQQFRQPLPPLPHIQVRENNNQIEINDARPV